MTLPLLLETITNILWKTSIFWKTGIFSNMSLLKPITFVWGGGGEPTTYILGELWFQQKQMYLEIEPLQTCDLKA